MGRSGVQKLFTDNSKGVKLTYQQIGRLDNRLAGVAYSGFMKFG